MKKNMVGSKKAVKSFFHNDINKFVDDMPDSEMKSLIKELGETRYWIAIVKYIQDRTLIANGTLIMLDPVKEPTKIARTQGIMSGLMDIYNMETTMKIPIDQAEKAFNEANDETPAIDNDGPQY